MKPFLVYLPFLLAVLVQGCSGSADICERGTYQETTSALLRARGLVNEHYPDGIPAAFDGAAWKRILQERDPTLFANVAPYDAAIGPATKGYTLTLSENGKAFVLDYSCTLLIDYWLCEVGGTVESLADPCR